MLKVIFGLLIFISIIQTVNIQNLFTSLPAIACPSGSTASDCSLRGCSGNAQCKDRCICTHCTNETYGGSCFKDSDCKNGGKCIGGDSEQCIVGECRFLPTTDDDCYNFCHGLKEGYRNGFHLKQGETCTSIGKNTENKCLNSKEINNCCCVPCKDNDNSCHCEYGTDESVICSAKEHINSECPSYLKSTNVNVPDPPITYKRDCSTNDHGYCGYCSCPENNNNICISTCSHQGCISDICEIANHEMGHWWDCFTNRTGSNSDSACTGIKNHVVIENATYNDCIERNQFPSDCNDTKNRLINYCNNYCSNKCPFSNEVKLICEKFGITCGSAASGAGAAVPMPTP